MPIPYVALIWIAFGHTPVHAWLAVGYRIVVTVVTWPRLPEQFVPQFFEAVGRLIPVRVEGNKERQDPAS